MNESDYVNKKEYIPDFHFRVYILFYLYMRKSEILTGQRFGRLIVKGQERRVEKSGRYVFFCICKCDCGNIKHIRKKNLKKGKSLSCGCLAIELISKRRRTHGYGHSNIYKIWNSMRVRCTNKKSKDFKNYGGRGILICESWINSFETFLRDMGGGYKKGLSLDRINNDGNYCKGNCRWATQKQQSNNTRRNVIVTYNGVVMTASQAADKIGVKGSIITNRLNLGWTEEKALSF